MSNTVDALKNLYKTLTGQDYSGDPNPTDAEMIDAIAKDASSGGGSGGGGTRVIKLSELEDITASFVDLPEGVVVYQYDRSGGHAYDGMLNSRSCWFKGYGWCVS